MGCVVSIATLNSDAFSRAGDHTLFGRNSSMDQFPVATGDGLFLGFSLLLAVHPLVGVYYSYVTIIYRGTKEENNLKAIRPMLSQSIRIMFWND